MKEYGENGPRFFQGSYNQALDKAKRDLKYLLVVLHSEDHDDTPQFCTETLCSLDFVGFINQKEMIVWAGNIKKKEPFKVAELLSATKYPFMALIALHDSQMKVVHRFEGVYSPQQCIDIIDRVMNRLERFYSAAQAER
jgi:FAS-associated factor 2